MESSPSTESTFGGVPHLTHIIQALLGRAEKNLTQKEWQWLAGAFDCADLVAENLEAVMTGIAGYLNWNSSSEKGGANTRYFQSPEDVATLLFFLAGSVSHIRALLVVGQAADTQLKNMR